MRAFLLAALFWAGVFGSASAHSMMTAYLDLKEQANGTTTVDWRRPVFPGNYVTLKPVFPSQAVAFDVQPPRDEGTFTRERYSLKGLPPYWSNQSIGLIGQGLSGMEVLIRLHLANGTTHVAVLRGDGEIFTVPEHANWLSASSIFMRLGFDHIIMGVDHLLFVFGLLLLVPNLSTLIKTITSFTIAHSITLGMATLGYATVPLPPVNLCVALSIFFLAPEILRKYRGETSLTIRRPWIVAFAFGLLHGFGFASGLTALGLPRPEIPFALFFFNVGVEIGQLLFVLLVLLLMRSLRQLEIHLARWTEGLPPYVVGSIGAYWTIQRAALLFTTGG